MVRSVHRDVDTLHWHLIILFDPSLISCLVQYLTLVSTSFRSCNTSFFIFVNLWKSRIAVKCHDVLAVSHTCSLGVSRLITTCQRHACIIGSSQLQSVLRYIQVRVLSRT